MEKTIYLDYEGMLTVVEEFMERSGIRHYCETKCLGDCCGGCDGKDTACHLHEGRRLACSMYLCVQLSNLIFPNRKVKDAYEELFRIVRAQLGNSRRKTGGKKYENPYFVPYSEKQMQSFRIQRSVVTKLMPSTDSINKISETMSILNSLAERVINRNKQVWRRKAKIKDDHLQPSIPS